MRHCNVVVAGKPSSYLKILALQLYQEGFSPEIFIETPSERPGREASLSGLLRVGEALYQRTFGRTHRAQSQFISQYWEDRIPADLPVKIHRFSSLNAVEARSKLQEVEPKFMLTYGPSILERETFDIPEFGTGNLHSAKLPEYRGTMPEFWILKHQNYDQAGMTLHRMTQQLDAGDVFHFLPVYADGGDRAADLRLRIQRKLLWVIGDWVKEILDRKKPEEQNEARAAVYDTPTFLSRVPVDLRRMKYLFFQGKQPVHREVCFPPGKRAAVAISNDIDCTTEDRFETVQKLFQETLDWSDFQTSIFFTQNRVRAEETEQIVLFPEEAEQLDTERPTETCQKLVHALEKGEIETNHCWGDYSEKGGFLRSIAERVVNWLSQHEISLPLFVNHGDANNEQKMGPGPDDAKGDIPDEEVYNLDMVREAGSRYFWVDRLTPHAVIGGKSLWPHEALAPVSRDDDPEGFYPAVFLSFMYAATGSELVLKGLHKLGWQYRPNRDLVKLHAFRDGSYGWSFLRSGRWERDDWRIFPLLLTDRHLEQAMEERGAIVVYTHMGKGEPSEEAIEALERVNQYDEIWKTSVSDLLDATLSCVDPQAPIFQGEKPAGWG